MRWIPFSLVLLSLIPMGGGAARVTKLVSDASDGTVAAADARFFDAPLPVLLHIFGASIYLILGAFQFDAAIRRNRPGWHRAAGRLLIPCGLTAALSGVWMALFYDMPDAYEGALTWARVLFGGAMAAFIVLGYFAIRRRDYNTHRAWMMRGYAIGLGAGTQAFTLGIFLLLMENPDRPAVFAGHVAGWMINLAVAEWFIRRPASVAPKIPELARQSTS